MATVGDDIEEEQMRREALARYGSTYDSEGRRDPFVPRILHEREKERGDVQGLRGVYIEELKLVGIYLFEGEAVAIFKGGPEDKGHTARKGDEFRDGRVVEVNYPGKKVTVRKDLRDAIRIRNYEDRTMKLHPLKDRIKK